MKPVLIRSNSPAINRKIGLEFRKITRQLTNNIATRIDCQQYGRSELENKIKTLVLNENAFLVLNNVDITISHYIKYSNHYSHDEGVLSFLRQIAIVSEVKSVYPLKNIVLDEYQTINVHRDINLHEMGEDNYDKIMSNYALIAFRKIMISIFQNALATNAIFSNELISRYQLYLCEWKFETDQLLEEISKLLSRSETLEMSINR